MGEELFVGDDLLLEAGEQIDDFTLNQMISMDDAIRERKSKMTVVPQIGALMERGEF